MSQLPCPENMTFGNWSNRWSFRPASDHDRYVASIPLTPDKWERIPLVIQEKLWKLMILPIPAGSISVHGRNYVTGLGFVDWEGWYRIDDNDHLDPLVQMETEYEQERRYVG